MFATLASKTFAILAVSLGLAYLGALFSAGLMHGAIQNGQPQKVQKIFYTALVIEIIAFIALMFLSRAFPLNMLLMAVFTLNSGATLGIYFLQNSQTVQKALAITAATTFFTGLIASYGGMDFSWLGKFLFIALIILIVIMIIRLFISMGDRIQRIISAFGVAIFTGYLLFDFNKLSKMREIAETNNWNSALSFAINIYLDIINLFVSLINLLSSNNN
jgi:FtsH-binding integral membrane protein